MIRGFYTGRTGAIEHQKLMSVAANNMANVNTDGYKASNLSFQELLYQRMRMPKDYEAKRGEYDEYVRRNRGLPPQAIQRYDPDEYDEGETPPSPVNYYSENKLVVGAGGRSTESAIVMTQGLYKQTGGTLDVLIKGDAFFAVQPRFAAYNEEGDEIYYYTKQGAFMISVEEDGEYLVTQNGEYVLDADYERILLPENRDDLRVAAHFDEFHDQENVIKLGLFTCGNIYALARVGENRYAPTALSGEMNLEERIDSVAVLQYGLEMSNVSIAEEMVKVIQAQRAFQSNLTVIRTADEIEGYINAFRG